MKKLGFGFMRLPQEDPDDYASPILLPETQEMVDAFLMAGFTHFDTAYTYNKGGSEKALRETLIKKYPRDSFTVTDKIPIYALHTEEEMAPVVAEMLENLGVDYFDYLWLHALSGGTYKRVQRMRAFEYAMQLREEGVARHIGMSYHGTPEDLETFLTEYPCIECVQLQINYLDWDDPAIRARECYEVCEKYGKDVMVMEPVKGGSLIDLPEEAEAVLRAANSGRSNADWALSFAASLPNVICVLSGMGSMAMLTENMAILDPVKPLSEEEFAATQRAAEIIRGAKAIGCTACRYCVSGCPMDIPIPDYFAIYNTGMRFLAKHPDANFTDESDVGNYYYNIRKVHGAPADCIKCGACEEHCPQHLPIRDLLEDVRKLVEG